METFGQTLYRFYKKFIQRNQTDWFLMKQNPELIAIDWENNLKISENVSMIPLNLIWIRPKIKLSLE
ncbi:hypothetical protein B1J93_20565 [Leptospira kirschneri serovar Pomona]|uniref:Uncharacterized protein n=1 Tax=Leptospira kirschneri serovar Pomona TaxID=561005 RepID=A0A1T1DGJ1_9LEPT|nr:hypothetical protein [Leptospira kirschneri]OOV39969.1 hypothetical protein B1J93_20565 [Leptospira kirschneri serovar Pomona]